MGRNTRGFVRRPSRRPFPGLLTAGYRWRSRPGFARRQPRSNTWPSRRTGPSVVEEHVMEVSLGEYGGEPTRPKGGTQTSAGPGSSRRDSSPVTDAGSADETGCRDSGSTSIIAAGRPPDRASRTRQARRPDGASGNISMSWTGASNPGSIRPPVCQPKTVTSSRLAAPSWWLSWMGSRSPVAR
jgi:hypothetical protein